MYSGHDEVLFVSCLADWAKITEAANPGKIDKLMVQGLVTSVFGDDWKVDTGAGAGQSKGFLAWPPKAWKAATCNKRPYRTRHTASEQECQPWSNTYNQAADSNATARLS